MRVELGQRIKFIDAGHVTERKTGLMVPLIGQQATVTDVGLVVAIAEIEGGTHDGTQVIIDRIGDPRLALADTITLDLSTFTRLDEIDLYAEKRNINRQDAIHELVNCGLAHHPLLRAAIARHPAGKKRSTK